MTFLTHSQLRLTHMRTSLIEASSSDKPLTQEPRLRLIQLSDLHFYEHTDTAFYDVVRQKVGRAVEDAANQGITSLIVVTGDTIHHGPHFVETAGEWLATLPSPKVAILGNHDYQDDAQSHAVRAMFQAAGLTLLVNEAQPLSSQCPSLPSPWKNTWLVGLDDYYAGDASLEAIQQAFEPVPIGAPTIVLAHNPLHFNRLAEAQLGKRQPQLILSGHTHAGHVYIPLLKPVYVYGLGHQYRYGWYRHPKEATQPELKGSRLYVSSGIGSAAFYPKVFGKRIALPPFRWNTWPEVVVLDVAL